MEESYCQHFNSIMLWCITVHNSHAEQDFANNPQRVSTVLARVYGVQEELLLSPWSRCQHPCLDNFC